MSNSLTAFDAEFWSAAAQAVIYKENAILPLANYELSAKLKKGAAKAHKPYPTSALTAEDYTKGSDVTLQDIGATDEYVTVDKQKITPFEIDSIDKIQNFYNSQRMYAEMAGKALKNKLEQDAAVEMKDNAGLYIDAGDVGGSAGDYISLTTSNINSIATAGGMKLTSYNRPVANRFWLMGPRTYQTLLDYLGGKDTNVADQVGENGKVGSRFGLDLVVSNNLPFSAKLSIGTNPTEGDTVTIAGVTFTFNATPSGAGSVDIGADAAGSVANLVAAINDSGTAGSTYIALSAKDRRRLVQNGVVATDGSTYLTIVGYGDISTSETLTAAGDVWSLQYSHGFVGIKKAVDIVLQKSVSFEFRKPQLRLGDIVLAWELYGTKVFEMNKDSLVDVRIDASGWTH